MALLEKTRKSPLPLRYNFLLTISFLFRSADTKRQLQQMIPRTPPSRQREKHKGPLQKSLMPKRVSLKKSRSKAKSRPLRLLPSMKKKPLNVSNPRCQITNPARQSQIRILLELPCLKIPRNRRKARRAASRWPPVFCL